MTDSPALTAELATAGWELSDDGKAISKSFRFRGFRDAITWSWMAPGMRPQQHP